MTFRILDRAQMSVTGAPGTGNITLGTNTTGYQTFAQAGLTDQDTFSYVVVDGTSWEYGVGTYTLATNVMSRAPTKTSAQNTTPISLSAKAIVSACLRGEDIQNAGTTLAGLTDVSVTEGAAINGYVLTWSNSTGRWIAQAPTTGGGGATTFAALTDVSLSSPSNGQVPVYNSSTGKWTNQTLSFSYTLENLTDVLVTSPTNGQALVWNSTASKWENSTISSGGGSLTVSGSTGITDIEFSGATVTASGSTATVTISGSGGGSSNSPPSTSLFSFAADGGSSTHAVSYTSGKAFNYYRTDTTGSSDRASFVGKAVPTGTPWSAKMQFVANNVNAQYARLGLALYDSASGKLILAGPTATPSLLLLYCANLTTYTTAIDTLTMEPSAVLPTWWKVVFDGTTYTFSFSWDDVQYFTLGTASTGSYMTATHVGVGSEIYNTFTVSAISVFNYSEGTS